MKGETVIECMRKNLKDRWVTATTVANNCDRGGGYTRDVLDTASRLQIIETRTELRRLRLYRVDPQNEQVVCPIEPERRYEESVCRSLEEVAETCASKPGPCREAQRVVFNTIMDSLRNKDSARARKLMGYLLDLE